MSARKGFWLIGILYLSAFLLSCGTGVEGGELESGEGEEHITGSHYQGQSCLQCHSFGGGTIFTKINSQGDGSQEWATYHTVLLEFKNGGSYKAPRGRGSGNFYVSQSNITGDFIVKVLDSSGKEVNRSKTYHTSDRYNCNSCHTQKGANGAPGRIVNYNYYGNDQSGGQGYGQGVYPILKNSCQGCHTQGGQAGGTNFIVSDAQTTYRTLTTGKPVTQGYNSFINKADPPASLLLLKATNQINHGGGQMLSTSSQDYQRILNWIQQGAPNN